MNRLAAIFFAAIALMGCSPSEGAAGFFENPEPIAANLAGALQEGQDPSVVPETQRNYLTGCVTGATGRMPDLVAVQETGLLKVCGCSYKKLVDKVRMEAAAVADPFATSSEIESDAFKRFRELDENFQGTEGNIDDSLIELFASCIRKAAA
jgi:hypothetical protein